ncbi:UbiX family flavin prenyltransferase [Candidatus Microgenomates bacterium]|nr:UbiX family flavin prenyltransferase [Candidatus Microgenomates bacterium]
MVEEGGVLPKESKEREGRKRIIIGMSGASVPQIGVRLLEVLTEDSLIETHLVISEGAKEVMKYEMGFGERDVAALEEKASFAYHERNMAASISSGSFKTDGMIVVPCSMKTLADIAWSRDENLVSRAAIVCLKEGRKVVLVPRETPFTLSYAENIVQAIRNGAVVLPPLPAFYHGPQTIDDIINHTVQKILDQFGIEKNLFRRWETPS